MTTKQREYLILDEEFTWDELNDISRYGANTGVNGFTYSSDLCDKYDQYEDEINDRVYDSGYTIGGVMLEHDMHTLQEYKEWACWFYLETQAQDITEAYDWIWWANHHPGNYRDDWFI